MAAHVQDMCLSSLDLAGQGTLHALVVHLAALELFVYVAALE